jgi:hypothetical protein
MAETDKLAEDERRFVTTLPALSPPIARAADLIRRYAEMVKNGLKRDDFRLGHIRLERSSFCILLL